MSQKLSNTWNKSTQTCKRSCYDTGKTELWASHKRLETFIKQEQIVFNKVCGKAGSICKEIIVDWAAILLSVMDGYDSQKAATHFCAQICDTVFEMWKIFWWKNLQKKVDNFPVLSWLKTLKNPWLYRKLLNMKFSEHTLKLPVSWRSNKARMTQHTEKCWQYLLQRHNNRTSRLSCF